MLVTVGITFLILGLVLASLGTWLSPLLALFGELFGTQKKQRSKHRFHSLDVLIPAHFERESLPLTIDSARKSILAVVHLVMVPSKVVVGLSAWTGPEAQFAARLADQVIEISRPGKWWALQALIKQSQAEWVALVDCGTTWPEDLVLHLSEYLSTEDVMAVNPSYREGSRGMLSKMIWRFEAFLKSLENKAGGPVSLHGATIFYRRECLEKAFEHLEGVEWLNDDVVVPLTLRMLFPERRIIYDRDVFVVDMSPSSVNSEVKRRKRLLFGNLQWIRKFFPTLAVHNPVLLALAMRRALRVMWAWWCLLIGLGFLFIVFSHSDLIITQNVILIVALPACLLVMSLAKGRRLLEAFFVSLALPYYYFSTRRKSSNVSWK